MTELEKLVRDIETLRESIQLLHIELSTELTPMGRQNLRLQIALLQDELKKLLVELWEPGDE